MLIRGGVKMRLRNSQQSNWSNGFMRGVISLSTITAEECLDLSLTVNQTWPSRNDINSRRHSR